MTELVSVIIPAYDSAILLQDLLESLRLSENQNFEVIINDEVRSTDDTKSVVEEFKKNGLAITYLKENHSMAQGRKRGAASAKGSILLHLDSDMRVTPDLISECVERISSGCSALIIPEESFGTTFWAKCKWLEKKCYNNVSQIESLRCVTADAYETVGGHNVKMVQSEDKDLDIRIHQAGFKVGRTNNCLLHNEGDLKLWRTMRKKYGYSKTVNIFAEAHPQAFRWQANILNRYVIYLKNCKYLFSHPFVYVGMIFMKTCEFSSGAAGIMLRRDRE